MTINPTGKVNLTDVDNEFHLGKSAGVMRGVPYFRASNSSISSFTNTNLDFDQFRGTQGKVSASITYSSDQQNITINTSNVPGYVANFSRLDITINNGVYIGSTSTGSYAMTITGFASGDTVNLINNGVIIGCGGNGGNHDSDGSPGGNALLLQCPVNITNNGTIAGGGGGGGGCASGSTYGSCLGGGGSYTGSGGGGGAGYNGGSGGSGDGNGNGGTRTSGGSGSTNQGNAGNGGNPGQSGTDSNNSGHGAGPGKYINGLGYANFLVSGTLLGPAS
jgi:hypothetical protein